MLQGKKIIARTNAVYERIRNRLAAAGRHRRQIMPLAVGRFSWFISLATIGGRIMAKGAMKAGKEARKPKKDAKKPAAAPTLKAPPVKATKLKDR
ncbi:MULTISPECIES: hypothetical protein [unclassified Mesorhizobium]|nr:MULTISPECIES: hypothetical protein [unclassified Mesorhizobium]